MNNIVKQGKVRDIYDEGDTLLLVSTERLSAFDRAICDIPDKGILLNQLSAWWFHKTQSIITNHLLEIPSSNSMRVKKCTVFPVEVIVRGYITGTTNTSLWTLYQQGQRQFWGNQLPDGLRKNQKLPKPILTPTTKAADHDKPMEPEDIKTIPGLTPALWQEIEEKALALYTFANTLLEQQGLILADTKYEFGLDKEGALCLIDEIHTPDSSRYWDYQDWEKAFSQNEEVPSFDKEIIRLWYRNQGDPYQMQQLPKAPQTLVQTVRNRYLQLFQRITGKRSLLCTSS